MLELQTLIESLTFESSIHICICDTSGILTQHNLRLSPDFTIHSKPVCLWAKSKGESNKYCVLCKMMSLRRAVEKKTPFIGKCVAGLSEIVWPVVIEGGVAAVIYLGNLTDDRGTLAKKLSVFARRFKLPAEKIPSFTAETAQARDFSHHMKTAGFVADFLAALCDKSAQNQSEDTHWVVEAIKNYAEEHYNTVISLKQLAGYYYFNENYMGRLFKKHTGKNFSEYLTMIRLKKALEILRGTDYSILKTSVLAGFNSVAYFNRLFKKHIGFPPSVYKRDFIEKENK